MNKLPGLVGLALLIALTAPDALAEKSNAEKKAKGAAHERSELSVEHQQKAATKIRVDEEKRALQERERAEEMREEAERMRERADDGAGQDGLRGHDNAASRGNEKSQEMRERRDERKQIKEEYRGDRENGQEGADLDSDDESLADEEQKKAKKPWWKFWGD